MLYDKLAIVDVETTGTSARSGRIIEIGIIRVEQGKVVERYQTLLDPEQPLSDFITSLTSIKNSDLQSAPTFSAVAGTIRELLEGCIFVAHNARFDYSFVTREFKRLDESYRSKQLCTVRLSRALFPDQAHHNLDALMQRWNLQCTNRHRALDDADVVWNWLQLLPDVVPMEQLQRAMQGIMHHTTLPPQFKNDSLNYLPTTPGVYLFKGEDSLLYVGKSKTIRQRVAAHFTETLESENELRLHRQTTDVEFKPTISELGALLLESSLVKQLQPIYNRKLRRQQKLLWLKRTYNDAGYLTPQIMLDEPIQPQHLEEVLGIFRTRKQAKDYLAGLVTHQQLCAKLAGVELGTGACFGHQLQRCRGACIQVESADVYNARAELALAERRLTVWPYAGATKIEEQDEAGNGEVFLIDHWCILGAWRYDDSGAVDQWLDHTEYQFDYDSYKILVRYLKQVNRSKLQLVPREQIGHLIIS